MDRNYRRFGAIHNAEVALRKESVDRNFVIGFIAKAANSSLSARRAWIEIEVPEDQYTALSVALRKESVDRNCSDWAKAIFRYLSLSARRAWIEMVKSSYQLHP